MTTKRRTRSRGAFTLVEMLVSTALIIFILVILSSVFTTGITALRKLRGVGHLQDHLRYTMTTLRNDLAQPHFGRLTDGLHGPNLSQQRLDMYDWTPPKEGFFRIMQLPELNPTTGQPISPLAYGVLEGIDGDQLPSTVARNHSLHFTVRTEPNTAQGTGRDQFFFSNSILPLLAQIPNLQPQALRMGQAPAHINNDNPSTLYSAWAEVAYFLRPSGQQAGSSNLYTLYRRRRVLTDIKEAYIKSGTQTIHAADSDLYAPGTNAVLAQATDASLFVHPKAPNAVYFNTPANVTVPFRRYGSDSISPAGLFPNPDPLVPAPGGYHSIYDDFPASNQNGGDDILLENVLSFEIKASWDIPTDPRINHPAVPAPTSFYTVPPQTPTIQMQNPEFPFDVLPLSPVSSNPALSFGNDTLAATGARVFDTWHGEDYTFQPLGAPATTVPYSAWKNRYENGGAVTPLQSAVTIPLRIRVKAIQIRIRVWDIRTQQARQVTIIQDL
jgi:hypothetical protein